MEMLKRPRGKASVLFWAAIFGLILPLLLFLGSASAAQATIYLSDTGWSKPVGTWDPATKTGTLTQDVTETIEIVGDGITLDGDGRTISTGWGIGVLVVERTGATIRNLKVERCQVYLRGSNGNRLINNTVSSGGAAIFLGFSHGNNLNGNRVSGVVGTVPTSGIVLWGSSNNTLTDNIVLNGTHGFYVREFSSGNVLTSNVASGNVLGIHLASSSGNTLTSNTVSEGTRGIYLRASSDANLLTGNAVSAQSEAGISLDSSRWNTLAGNTASQNESGVFLFRSHNNTLTGNTASNNGLGVLLSWSGVNTLTGNRVSSNDSGIELLACNGNDIYRNNFINNTTQAYVSGGSGNLFNLDAPLGGNYWSDWTTPDADRDGFVDSPYVFIGGVDYLPWARQSGWEPPADTTPPATTLTADPAAPNGLNDWYVTAPTMTLTAEDEEGGSGVDKIYYRWDTGIDQEYTGSLTAPEGTHTLYYHSTDMAGNEEDEESQQLKVDTIVPAPPAILQPANNSSIDNPVTIGGTAEALTAVKVYDGRNLLAALETGLDGSWAMDPLALAEGPHTLTVTTTDEAGNTSAPSAAVQITVRYASTLVFNPECSTSGQYSDSALLSATLTSNLGPVPFKQVTFVLGTQACVAVTDENGVARTAILLDQIPSSYSLAVSFAGDETYRGASAAQPFTITKEDTALTYSGDLISQVGGTVHLSARLSDADSDAGVAGRTIAFTLGSQTIEAQTNQDGVTEAYLLITQPQGFYTISASFAGDVYYVASTSPVTEFVVYDPFSAMKVTGGGWLALRSGKANFGFNARYEPGASAPTGQFQYVDHDGGPKVHSAALDWLVFVGNRAVFAGPCTVGGVGGYRLRVEAADGGEPAGGTDSFKIAVQDPSGTQVYSAEGALTKGNIQIHPKR